MHISSDSIDLTFAVICYVLQRQRLLTVLESYNRYYSLDNNSTSSLLLDLRLLM